MENSNKNLKFYSQNGKPKNHQTDELSNLVSDEFSDEQTIDLPWVLAVLSRRAWIMAVTAFLLSIISGGTIVWYSKQAMPSYEGSIKLLIEPVTAEGRLARLLLLGESGGNTDLTDITAKLGINSTDLVDYETMIRVLTSPKIMDPLVEKIQTKYPEVSYNSLVSQLILNRVTYEKDAKQEGTKILLVRYQDKDTSKILFVLENVVDSYLNYSLEERLNTLGKGIEFINEQLPHLEKRVDFFQAELQKLRQENGINFPNIDAQTLSDQLLAVTNEKFRLQSQLEAQKITYNQFKIKIEEKATESIGILNLESETYKTIRSELQELDAELSAKLTQFQPNSIPIQILQEKRMRLMNVLQEIAQTELKSMEIGIQALESRVKSLDKDEQEIKAKLKIFPDVLRRYSEIERNLEVTNQTLKTFLEKRESLSLNASQKDFPWYVMSPPKLTRNSDGFLKPTSQSSTRKQLALTVILSTLLGVGIGLIIEVLDPVFHTPEEVRFQTKLKLIATVPIDRNLKKTNNQQKRVRQGWFDSDPNQTNWYQPEYSAFFIESFRSLYANISLLGLKNSSIRSLVVSSASHQDGKSTIALNLAQTAAAIGKRVLLVDADLRKPDLHVYLGLSNQQGLSDSVTHYLSLNEVIQQSALEENLFFLSAGQFTPDPIKLLSSQKMQYLMGQFQGFFDLVIYDTPPLVGLADAHIVAAHADGLVLVVGLEKTDRSMVNQALDELEISGATVLGVVTNQLKKGGSSKHSQVKRDYVSQQMRTMS